MRKMASKKGCPKTALFKQYTAGPPPLIKGPRFMLSGTYRGRPDRDDGIFLLTAILILILILIFVVLFIRVLAVIGLVGFYDVILLGRPFRFITDNRLGFIDIVVLSKESIAFFRRYDFNRNLAVAFDDVRRSNGRFGITFIVIATLCLLGLTTSLALVPALCRESFPWKPWYRFR